MSGCHLFPYKSVRDTETCDPKRRSSNATSASFGSSGQAQAIRDSSNRLASLSFNPRRQSLSTGSPSEPQVAQATSPIATTRFAGHKPAHPSHLSQSVSNDELHTSPPAKATPIPGSLGTGGRSGLSMMMDREENRRVASLKDTVMEISNDLSPVREDGRGSPATPPISDGTITGGTTPMLRRRSLIPDPEPDPEPDPDEGMDSSGLRRYLASEMTREDVENATETSPLLKGGKPIAGQLRADMRGWGRRARKWTAGDVVNGVVLEPVKLLPSVVLGLLLNVLDGVSYGMIL